MMLLPALHHAVIHRSRLAAGTLAGAVLLAACGSAAPTPPPSPTAAPLPSPTCAGIDVSIDGLLPCDEVVDRATAAVAEQSPDDLARGVASIAVFLNACSERLAPRIPCGGERYVQYVTFTFEKGPDDQVPPELTVAVAPVSGKVLGAADPLKR